MSTNSDEQSTSVFDSNITQTETKTPGRRTRKLPSIFG